MTAVVLIYTGDGVMYFGSRPTPTPIQVQQSVQLKLAISKFPMEKRATEREPKIIVETPSFKFRTYHYQY